MTLESFSVGQHKTFSKLATYLVFNVLLFNSITSSFCIYTATYTKLTSQYVASEKILVIYWTGRCSLNTLNHEAVISASGRYRLLSPTCSVCAVCRVKGAFPQSDFMRYDGKAVDISFLGGTLSLKVLWSRPQVCE